MFSKIAGLPLWAKVLLALIALGLAILLSPFTIVVTIVVLIIAIFALIYRLLRRRSLRKWGIVALASLLLIPIFAGGTLALYGSGASRQASSPSEQKEAVNQREPSVEEVEKEADPSEKEDAQKDESRFAASSEEETEEGQDERGSHDATVRVSRVVDGDTIRISPSIDGKDEVRLIGVDTPETKEPGCEVQPYGSEASEFTTSELQGEEVELEFDKDRDDRYDRLLAYVYKDGEMFNETLLEEGYAQVYIVSPNDKYEDRFEEAQEEAQAAERGIWALLASEQALLTDRGNGIGGDGCVREETAAPPATPPVSSPEPPPVPEPDVPSVAETPPKESVSSTPPSSGLRNGADCSTGVKNVPVVPGSKGDGDGDGIACERR